MQTRSVVDLVALTASCHFDKFFSGGETPLAHDPPAGLAFARSPGNARAGQQLSQVRVAVVDSRGTPVAGADSLITVALGAHPSNAALTGTTSTRAANGVATFSDLRIDKPGTAYTLTATVTGLTPDTSAPFHIMPQPMPSSVTVTATPTGPSPDTAGQTAQTNFTITCSAPANQPPTAAFTPSCNFLDCSFASTSSDPDGTITSQQWNFGDGMTGSGANPSHTYSRAGTFTVTLTVTDNAGATDVVSHDVQPIEPPPPNQQPIVSAGSHQNEVTGIQVSLEGASFSDPDHTGPWTVTIDWGDGGVSQFPMTSEGTINATHTYVVLLPTDFTVTVTVEDAQRASGSASKTI